MVIGRRRGMKKIAVLGFGAVFAVNVHMAAKGLSVGEATLAKRALVRAFSGVVVDVVFRVVVILWLIFIAGTSKIHAAHKK